VVACSNPVDGYFMIQQAVASDDPVIFLEPKRQYHADKAEVDESIEATDFQPLLTSRILRAGSDVTLLGYGPTVKTCMKVAEAAASEGRSIEVVDLRTLSPLDLGRSTTRYDAPAAPWLSTRRTTNLGMGSEIAARITERCLLFAAAPVLRVGGFDTAYPPARIEEHYLPDLDRVLDAVDRSMASEDDA